MSVSCAHSRALRSRGRRRVESMGFTGESVVRSACRSCELMPRRARHRGLAWRPRESVVRSAYCSYELVPSCARHRRLACRPRLWSVVSSKKRRRAMRSASTPFSSRQIPTPGGTTSGSPRREPRAHTSPHHPHRIIPTASSPSHHRVPRSPHYPLSSILYPQSSPPLTAPPASARSRGRCRPPGRRSSRRSGAFGYRTRSGSSRRSTAACRRADRAPPRRRC